MASVSAVRSLSLAVKRTRVWFECWGVGVGLSVALMCALLVVGYAERNTRITLQTTVRYLFENTLSRVDLALTDLNLSDAAQDQWTARLNLLLRFQSYLKFAVIERESDSKWRTNSLTPEGLLTDVSPNIFKNLNWNHAKTKDIGEFFWASSLSGDTLFLRRSVISDYEVVGQAYVALDMQKILSATHFSLIPSSPISSRGEICLSNTELVAGGNTPCFLSSQELLWASVHPKLSWLVATIMLLSALGYFLGLFWKKVVFEPRVWLSAISESADNDQITFAGADVLIEIRKKSPAYSKLIEAVKNNHLSHMYTQLAHDLRSPLAALTVICSQNKAPSEAQVTLLKEVSARLHKICESIIQKEHRVSRTAINKVLRSLVDEKSVIAPQIIFKLELPDEPLWANISDTDFARVFSNLLNNAIEHSPAGSEVQVKVESKRQGVKIVVQDQGRGIPRDILKKIGTVRISTREDSTKPGLGLGTTHASRIIKMAGGDIQWSSSLNKGTKVTVFLLKDFQV